MSVTKAVVMARGLGSRMRRDAGADLRPDQAEAAASGAKAMMPVGERPFLDHSLSRLAAAGITDVCLVVAPDHEEIRSYYDAQPLSRITVHYAVQAEPRGTADAIAAAADFTGRDRFVAVNGDNLYPVPALRALLASRGSAVIGFAPSVLISESNIPEERLDAFAVLTRDPDGALTAIVEKPTPEQAAAFGRHPMVSMNCWLFEPTIQDACRRIGPSVRGEYEVVDAVRLLMTEGVRFDVIPVAAGVLDLSSRGDVPAVTSFLEADRVRL
ncbi:nucleotidyltransferase family protein [Propioniciclava coleopterorum]|uniref:Nucleotidyltransferase family protein n=1 Tax=Propioniciclava coleopterorum TaxID=2714937 RepID=A0A6G7Y6P6_9ACTN|nr:nucleotidyltransferase family protein [Propioniciclava coleopterorum]QIK72485.1 nucleotidyltransferase family protein [Propioniciclava coleopterorum]